MFALIAARLRAEMPDVFKRADVILAARVPLECEYCGKPFQWKNGSGNHGKRFCKPTCYKAAWTKRQRSKR